jgi:hypothetical protein
MLLAANVWHWWIGIALTLVGLLVLVALVVGYLQSVSAKEHPGRGQVDRTQHHTDL